MEPSASLNPQSSPKWQVSHPLSRDGDRKKKHKKLTWGAQLWVVRSGFKFRFAQNPGVSGQYWHIILEQRFSPVWGISDLLFSHTVYFNILGNTESKHETFTFIKKQSKKKKIADAWSKCFLREHTKKAVRVSTLPGKWVLLIRLLLFRLKSYSTLCDPWTIACQTSLSMEFLQARILEWVAISFSGIFPDQGSNPHLQYWQADS